MSIVALVIVITSISNPESVPDITVTSYYDSMNECHLKLDELKRNINAIEVSNIDDKRIVKLYNREYHKQGIIYWSCLESKK